MKLPRHKLPKLRSPKSRLSTATIPAPQPKLIGLDRMRRDTAYAVLVLHGGKEDSRQPVHPLSTAKLRMLPFVRAISQAVGSDVPVLRLTYRMQGWNGASADPLQDARWALAQMGEAAPGVQVALVGHSMGGRVALHLLEHPQICAVVALAPWIARGDRVQGRPGQQVLLRHAAEDLITDPRATAAVAERLRRQGVTVTLEVVRGDNHAMLRHPEVWHRQAAAFVRSVASAGDEADA